MGRSEGREDPKQRADGSEQDAGNERRAKSGLPHKPSEASGGRSGAVLPPEGRWEHCGNELGQPLRHLQISPPFLFSQSPMQKPHCNSSSQEMGLEKTSLSNQRS